MLWYTCVKDIVKAWKPKLLLIIKDTRQGRNSVVFVDCSCTLRVLDVFVVVHLPEQNHETKELAINAACCV